MSCPIEVIAYHGWGFERSCWSDWQRLFASCQGSFTAFDRGYFGNGDTPTFTGNYPAILLAHSYGLHLCPKEQLQQADMLIIFSSFVNFHPQIDPKKRRSQRVLQQMLQEFQQHPDRVLNTFKIRCDYPTKSQDSTVVFLNHTLLFQDLQTLDTSYINIENFASISNIIVLHGTEDQIVSATKGEELYQQFTDNTQAVTEYIEIKGAGHTLPFTHTQACWNLLNSKLHRVFNLCN